MSVLQKIGTIVKSLLGKPNSVDLDKTEIINNIETILMTAVSLKDALNKQGVTDSLAMLHQSGVKYLEADVKHLQSIYNVYFQKLPSKWQQAERDVVFSAYRAAVGVLETNLTLLRENFGTVFNGVDSSEITLSEMRVTTVAALGWLENVETYFNWMVYFIGNVVSNGERVPPYQMIWIQDHVVQIADYTKELLLQSRNETVLTMLEDSRKKGSDLHVEVDGKTIDTYASDSHYSPEMLQAMHGFRMPSRIVGTIINNHRIKRWENMKAKREWLASKVGYLTLQANGLDPESPEAIRLKNITTKYAELVAQLDKQLLADSDG